MSTDAHPDRPGDPLRGPAPSTEPAVETTSTTSGTPATATPPTETAGADPVSSSSPTTQLPESSRSSFAEVDGSDPVAGDRTTTLPSADEDAALRDERARRFGRPQPEAAPVDPDPAPATTTVAPPVAAPATQTMPASTESGDDDPFKDFDDGPTSRAAAHWWSILFSIIFVPVGWYLLTDGGERTAFSLDAGGPLNLAGPAELVGGALALFVVLLAARWSSVGVILTGVVSFLIGVAFLVVNDQAMDLVATYQGTLVQALEQLGQNIVDHLLADASTGRTAIYGLVLIMVGVVSHGARRQGRREERRRAALGA